MQNPLAIPDILDAKSIANFTAFIKKYGIIPAVFITENYAMNNTSAIQTIPHTLGKPPSSVQLSGFAYASGGFVGCEGGASGNGSLTGTNQNCVSMVTGYPAQSVTQIVYFSDGTNKYAAVATWDAKNIYLDWTKTASGFDYTLYFMLKIQ